MARPVRIARIALTDFRNYARLDVAFAARHIVLTGDNGAGKTNLLEALSLLSPGRGLRRAAHAETVRASGLGDAAGYSIFAAVDGMAGPAEIGTGTLGGEAEQRRLRIGGANERTLDVLLDHLRVAWLTPSMDGLFTGPAGDRRRFLDRLVLAIDPMHARRSIDYERAMRSRNRLLAEGRFDPAWLDGIELQMAELGIAMAFARQHYVTLLGDLIARGDLDDAAAFPAADVSLDGFLDDASGLAAVDLEARYIEALRDGRRRDAAAGRTLDGPHRADLVVRHRQKSMPAALCSTGEQKALLVGLLLAHARLVADMTGYAPLLLLDEIAAHLDSGRRAALFSMIDAIGGQAFMTGTDAAMFAALGEGAQFFQVDAGVLKEFRP
jgi:DNA replication and repair protein RecF